MNTKTLFPTAVCTLALLLTTAGLSADAASARAAGATNVPATVSPPTGVVTVGGDGPVSTLILIDRTAVNDRDPALALADKNAALEMAAPTIARGGTLSLQVFGSVAGHALNIYTTQIQTLAQAGPAARDDAAQTATLAAALNVAVGLTQPPSSIAAQALKQVTGGPGSDIALSVGLGITDLVTDPAPTRDVLVETDGWIQQTGQESLAQLLGHSSPQAAATTILHETDIQPGTRPVSLLRMIGLGSTAGRADPSSQSIQKLQQAWSIACQHLPVEPGGCSISTETT